MTELKIVQNEAVAMHNYVIKGTIISALALHYIHEHKLYKELGYDTFGEYIECELPFGKSNAHRYLTTARILLDIHQIDDSKELIKFSIQENTLNSNESLMRDKSQNIGALAEVEFNKIVMLTHLPIEQLRRLNDYQRITFGSASLTVDELKRLTRKELAELIEKSERPAGIHKIVMPPEERAIVQTLAVATARIEKYVNENKSPELLFHLNNIKKEQLAIEQLLKGAGSE